MAKKSKAAKDDTATRVEEFTAGKQDRMIRLIKDLQREREDLTRRLANEQQISRRLADAIAGDLITNPYYVALQRRHQTVMGMLGQLRVQVAGLFPAGVAASFVDVVTSWIDDIIGVDLADQ